MNNKEKNVFQVKITGSLRVDVSIHIDEIFMNIKFLTG
jgi:hypothetical protein